MVSIVLAAALVGLAAFSVIRLPFLHPLQLWSVPWALATGLFALHLLPYRPLSASTAALIAACTACFALGLVFAARLRPGAALARVRRIMPCNHSDPRAVELAAALACLLTFVGLALFLAELVARFGLRDALVSSADVRVPLSNGAAALTIKYLYAGYAAAALCGVAAALVDDRRRRRWWLGLGAIVVAAQYFNTGRSNIVLAAVVLIVAESVARRRRPTVRIVAAGSAALVAFLLAIFTVGGAIIGKTLDNSPLSTIASPLTEHELLRPLTLPYLYATAPIPALDVQAEVAASTDPAFGCATLSVLCRIGARAGLDMVPEPAIRPFTGRPLPWNTYTAIDLPLIDGGPALAALFFVLVGWLAGTVWHAARQGVAGATVLYALYASALVYASTQNNFLAPHVVGASLLALLLIAAAGARADRRTRAAPASGPARRPDAAV